MMLKNIIWKIIKIVNPGLLILFLIMRGLLKLVKPDHFSNLVETLLDEAN